MTYIRFNGEPKNCTSLIYEVFRSKKKKSPTSYIDINCLTISLLYIGELYRRYNIEERINIFLDIGL